jgi:hypothetical protein
MMQKYMVYTVIQASEFDIFIAALSLFGTFPVYYYFLFQKSTNDAGIWFSIVGYVSIITVAKMMNFGFPSYDLEEQLIQLKDPVFNAQHFVLTFMMQSWNYVPYMLFYNPNKKTKVTQFGLPFLFFFVLNGTQETSTINLVS